MSIPSVLKSAVAALALVASGSLFAQGTPINAAAFDALVAQGPVADAATIAASPWASKIKQAGTLRLGGTQTSNLFSLLNEKDGKARGFDAGLAQLITRYILGDASKVQFTQVTSSTREQVLINNQVVVQYGAILSVVLWIPSVILLVFAQRVLRGGTLAAGFGV